MNFPWNNEGVCCSHGSLHWQFNVIVAYRHLKENSQTSAEFDAMFPRNPVITCLLKDSCSWFTWYSTKSISVIYFYDIIPVQYTFLSLFFYIIHVCWFFWFVITFDLYFLFCFDCYLVNSIHWEYVLILVIMMGKDSLDSSITHSSCFSYVANNHSSITCLIV